MGAAVLQGCRANRPLKGRLWTNTVRPYSTNFRSTPTGTKSCVIRDYRIREPLTRYNVSAEWDTDAIRRAAGRAGITRINYMDQETFSLLFGAFRRRKLIVHGD